MKMDMSEEEFLRYQLSEIKRCMKSFIYFCERYVLVRTPFHGERTLEVPFKLEDFQRKFIADLESHPYNICVKFRQGGFTTMTVIHALWEVLFKMDHRVLILSKTDREALNILRMAQLALDNLPKWMVDIDKTNSHEIKTKDGSSICSMACEAVCGRNCDHLIIDEPAFISDMERYWYSFYPCVMNKEGKVTVVSTTNGAKGWFYETYMSALREENEFHVIDIPFWESSFFRDKARVREMRLNLTEKGFAQEILGVFL